MPATSRMTSRTNLTCWPSVYAHAHCAKCMAYMRVSASALRCKVEPMLHKIDCCNTGAAAAAALPCPACGCHARASFDAEASCFCCCAAVHALPLLPSSAAAPLLAVLRCACTDKAMHGRSEKHEPIRLHGTHPLAGSRAGLERPLSHHMPLVQTDGDARLRHLSWQLEREGVQAGREHVGRLQRFRNPHFPSLSRQAPVAIAEATMAMDEAAVDYFGTTFSVEDEDHTLANSLRFFLNKKCVRAWALMPACTRGLDCWEIAVWHESVLVMCH